MEMSTNVTNVTKDARQFSVRINYHSSHCQNCKDHATSLSDPRTDIVERVHSVLVTPA